MPCPSDAACLALVLLLTGTSSTPAQAPSPASPLHLADCIRIAGEQQPVVAAARVRLAIAQTKLHAIEQVRAPALLLNRDLPVRRVQGRLGLAVAQAGLDQAELDTRYGVTRAYYTVQYARAQKRVLDALVNDLTGLRALVALGVLQKTRAEWTEATLDLVSLYLGRVEARQIEADRGVALALAALREAMGLPPDACPDVADEPLPTATVQPCREEIIAQTLAHRGEVRQTALGVEVVGLEADAQGRLCLPGGHRTFAAGSDIHARQVPPPLYGENYRPGAIPLAMPTLLGGSRRARVEIAREYGTQATAVATKARNLVVLEAEAAYLDWKEWSRKAALARRSAASAERMARALGSKTRNPITRALELAIPEHILAAEARSSLNEALYREIIALADLERITGGAFCAGLVERAAAK